MVFRIRNYNVMKLRSCLSSSFVFKYNHIFSIKFADDDDDDAGWPCVCVLFCTFHLSLKLLLRFRFVSFSNIQVGLLAIIISFSRNIFEETFKYKHKMRNFLRRCFLHLQHSTQRTNLNTLAEYYVLNIFRPGRSLNIKLYQSKFSFSHNNLVFIRFFLYQ